MRKSELIFVCLGTFLCLALAVWSGESSAPTIPQEESVASTAEQEPVTQPPSEQRKSEEEVLPEEKSDEAKPPNVSQPEHSFKVGVYTDLEDPFDNLTIHEITDDTIVFSCFWYRAWGIDYATAVLDGDTATFSWEDEFGFNSASGYLKSYEDDMVVLTLTSASYEYIHPGRYAFEYFGTEEELQTSYNEGVLLMNNDQEGWGRGRSNYDEPIIYIRFYEGGMLKCWIGTDWGGEVTFESFEMPYDVGADTIHIDGCAYDLYAYTAGATTMSLDALGSYDLDLSGDYTLEEDYVYPGLIEYF